MEMNSFFNVWKKVPMATKPREGGGDKGLSGKATKKRTFFAASLNAHGDIMIICTSEYIEFNFYITLLICAACTLSTFSLKGLFTNKIKINSRFR